jgi:hypothetical protein
MRLIGCRRKKKPGHQGGDRAQSAAYRSTDKGLSGARPWSCRLFVQPSKLFGQPSKIDNTAVPGSSRIAVKTDGLGKSDASRQTRPASTAGFDCGFFMSCSPAQGLTTLLAVCVPTHIQIKFRLELSHESLLMELGGLNSQIRSKRRI